jgi:hypothetical protein
MSDWKFQYIYKILNCIDYVDGSTSYHVSRERNSSRKSSYLHNKKNYYFLYSIFAYNLGIFTFMTLNNYLIQFKILKYKHFNHFYKTKKSEVTG